MGPGSPTGYGQAGSRACFPNEILKYYPWDHPYLLPLQTQIFRPSILRGELRVGAMPRKLSVFLTRLLKTKGDDAGEVRVITKSAMGKGEGNSAPTPKEPRRGWKEGPEQRELDRVGLGELEVGSFGGLGSPPPGSGCLEYCLPHCPQGQPCQQPVTTQTTHLPALLTQGPLAHWLLIWQVSAQITTPLRGFRDHPMPTSYDNSLFSHLQVTLQHYFTWLCVQVLTHF